MAGQLILYSMKDILKYALPIMVFVSLVILRESEISFRHLMSLFLVTLIIWKLTDSIIITTSIYCLYVYLLYNNYNLEKKKKKVKKNQ